MDLDQAPADMKFKDTEVFPRDSHAPSICNAPCGSEIVINPAATSKTGRSADREEEGA